MQTQSKQELKENIKDHSEDSKEKIPYRRKRNPMYGPAKFQNKFNQIGKQETFTADSKIKNIYPVYNNVSDLKSFLLNN